MTYLIFGKTLKLEIHKKVWLGFFFFFFFFFLRISLADHSSILFFSYVPITFS